MPQVEYTDWLCRSCKSEFRYSKPGRPKYCPYCQAQQLSRPDLLDGLSAKQRGRRILKDVEFISKAVDTGSASGMAAAPMEGMKLWDGREMPSAVVGARVDLDSPIYFPDNIITQCADCDCDIQLRPDTPKAPPAICVCCCARRIRERRP